eukprot:scaffold277528_cov15-Prasinocladus_malaysianus.AAC.1
MSGARDRTTARYKKLTPIVGVDELVLRAGIGRLRRVPWCTTWGTIALCTLPNMERSWLPYQCMYVDMKLVRLRLMQGWSMVVVVFGDAIDFFHTRELPAPL